MAKIIGMISLALLIACSLVNAQDPSTVLEQYEAVLSKQECTRQCVNSCQDSDFNKCLHQCSCDLMLSNSAGEGPAVGALTQEQLAFGLMQTKDKWVEYKQYANKLKKEEKKLAKAATLLKDFQDAAYATSLSQGCNMHCAHQCINIKYELALQVECIQGSCECSFSQDVSQLFSQNLGTFTDLEFETVEDYAPILSQGVETEQTCNATCTNQCDAIRDSIEEPFYKRCLVARCRCTLDQLDSKLSGSLPQGQSLMALGTEVQETNNSERIMFVTLVIVFLSLLLGASALLSPLRKRYLKRSDVEQNSKGKVKYVGQKKMQKKEKKTKLITEEDKLAV